MNPYYYGMYRMTSSPEDLEREERLCVSIGKSKVYKIFLGVCIGIMVVIAIVSIL